MVTPSFFGYMLSPIIRAGKSFFTLMFNSVSNVPASIRFIAFGGDSYQTTETDVQIFIDKEITLLRNNATIPFNTSTGAFEITFRDDGVDIASSKITVPASTTGKFDSGDISETILAGSLINEKTNRIGGATINNVSVLAEMEK